MFFLLIVELLPIYVPQSLQVILVSWEILEDCYCFSVNKIGKWDGEQYPCTCWSAAYFSRSPCTLFLPYGLLDSVWWMCRQLVYKNDPCLRILNLFHLLWRTLGLSSWMTTELNVCRLAGLLEFEGFPHIRGLWKSPKGWSCTLRLSWYPIHFGEVDLCPQRQVTSYRWTAVTYPTTNYFQGWRPVNGGEEGQSQRVSDRFLSTDN